MFYFTFILSAFIYLSSCFASIIQSEKMSPPFDVYQPPDTDAARIVGGQEANIEDYPYQVSFIVNQTYFCGGFIISEKYILTAAHCAQDVDPATVVLRAGSSWRTNGTVIPISKVTPHPQYDNPAFDKDVAVMETVSPIEFNDRTQPIGLPNAGEPINSGTLTVAGWGLTQQDADQIPERLMAVQIPVVPYIQCLFVYGGILTRNMFCGGNLLGGQGICQGDSGGTAIYNGKAFGITSFGRGCAQLLSPGVFANVASPLIRSFIKEQTGL